LKKALIFLSLLIISNLSFSEGTNLESINQNTVIATETDNKPQKVTLDVKSVGIFLPPFSSIFLFVSFKSIFTLT